MKKVKIKTSQNNEKQLEFKLMLVKDFEDFTKSEIQELRNQIRKVYRINAEIKISSEMLLHAYLIFKRKEILTLETVVVSPYPQITGESSFVVEQTNYPPVVISTFDGIYGSQTETFVIKGWQTLPVLTVFYFETHTIVYCLAPNGHFCKIDSHILRFDI